MKVSWVPFDSFFPNVNERVVFWPRSGGNTNLIIGYCTVNNNWVVNERYLSEHEMKEKYSHWCSLKRPK